MRDLSYYNRYPAQDSNQAHPEYKSEAWPLESTCSVNEGFMSYIYTHIYITFQSYYMLKTDYRQL
jgi:hypothetical protein